RRTRPLTSYPLSLHDALPICLRARPLEREVLARAAGPVELEPERVGAVRSRNPPRCDLPGPDLRAGGVVRLNTPAGRRRRTAERDRKSTRLNSSHQIISYAVF